MKSLKCTCKNRPVCLDSRVVPEYRRRRYECPGCGARWTTVEMVLEGFVNAHNGKELLAEKLDKSCTFENVEKAKRLLDSARILLSMNS